nr:RNA-directed DNA polymerase, eukaryota, reverse transcriptase zinc-binding domain protein [Tanacetum cinerariifolium]
VSDNSHADIESFSPSPIPNLDSDSHMEEIDLYFNLDDPMPPSIEEDDDDSERDMPILEKLLDNYALSLPANESYHFDIPSPYRPPAKPPDGMYQEERATWDRDKITWGGWDKGVGLHLSLEKDLITKRIKGVFVGRPCINLSHFFFADDVIILSEWNVQDLHNITSTLNSFYQVSVLNINISKSNLFGIGVTDDELHEMVHVTGCQASSFPITYLGLPIAPETVINTLEKYRARFFWGGASEKRKMAWVRWDQALASHEKGGLNIGSLKAFNLALLQKWNWRFIKNPNLLWVKLIKAIHGFEAGFDGKGCATSGIWSIIVGSTNYLHSRNFLPKDVLKCHPGNDNKIRFWKDHWIGNEPLCSKYNRLYRLDVNKNCLLSKRYFEGTWN